MTLTAKIDAWTRAERIPSYAHVVLYPLSLLYGAVVKARLLLYSIRIAKPRALTCPVVSVGNITTGGTGKTPVVILLVRLLETNGLRVAVLSRGYKGSSTGVGVVSDGKEVLLSPEEAGDEPYLMAMRLPGVPVLVSKDRFGAGTLATSKFAPDVIILDDGFQHIRLHRDLDLLLVDGRTGFGNHYLLPRGPLREPESAASRADAIMIKVPYGSAGKQTRGRSDVKGLDRPVIEFSYRPASLVSLSGETLDVASLKGAHVAAVAGVADPSSFITTLDSLGAVVVYKFIHPDHHAYSAADIDEISAARATCDIVVTTEKDAVKLERISGGHSTWIWALVVEACADEEKLLPVLAPVMRRKGERGAGDAATGGQRAGGKKRGTRG